MRFCIKELLFRDRFPKFVLKEAWQVQHDEELQQRTGIEKSIAGQETPIQNRLPSAKEYHVKQFSKIKDEQTGSESWRILSKLVPGRRR